MTLQEFVQQGWQKHGDDEQGVFDSLPEGVEMVSEAKHGPALAGLVVHVAGEHLGRWADGLDLVDRIEQNPVVESGSPEWKSLRRSKAILHHCAGETEARDQCIADGHDDTHHANSGRVRVLAVATSALAGQKRIDDAMAAFDEAIELAAYGPTKEDPVSISLAITGNNLATELEGTEDRDDAASALMLKAAQVGRKYWEIAGTWTNVERAEYRLAMTNLALGDGGAALRHAQACLAVCEDNHADEIELFFAREALAKSHHALGNGAEAHTNRDSAAELLAAIENEGMRSYCQGEFDKLNALLA
jgi:hypothetical protein